MMMSLAYLLPIAISAAYGDGALWAFVTAMVLNFGCGCIIWLATRRYKQEILARDSMLLVTLTWAGAALFATVPLLLTAPTMSFTDAYFETMSGLTTTGSTVMSNLDRLAPSLNVWRGLLQWLGGMGIIVLVVAILPVLGVGGRQVFKAETPGPMKDTQLTPRIAETAKGLWMIYVGLSLLCLLAYKLAGMSWFDALVHAFTTMSTGGFSSHDANFGFFDSPLLETIAIVFMTIGAINFGTHFMVLRGRTLKPYRRDPEIAWSLFALFASCAAIGVYLYAVGVYPDLATALRHASFSVVSVATTTGFATEDYNLWPVFAPLWMLFLAAFASCSGSTGGGIKMIRALILYKQVYREFVRLLHPTAAMPMKIEGTPIENKVVFAVLAFLFIYIVCIVSFTLILAASGLDIVTGLSAVIACLNNIGPGLGGVGPATTFARLNDFQLWVLAAAMLIGRLELFTVLILFTPVFWRK